MISPSSSEEAFERIDRLLGQIELPDDETNRQIVLTTLVVMQHALAIERGDFTGASSSSNNYERLHHQAIR